MEHHWFIQKNANVLLPNKAYLNVLMTNPVKDQNNCDPGHFHIQLYRNSLHLSLPNDVTQNHADLFEDYEIGFGLTDVEFERLTETLSCIIELQGQLDISSG